MLGDMSDSYQARACYRWGNRCFPKGHLNARAYGPDCPNPGVKPPDLCQAAPEYCPTEHSLSRQPPGPRG